MNRETTNGWKIAAAPAVDTPERVTLDAESARHDRCSIRPRLSTRHQSLAAVLLLLAACETQEISQTETPLSWSWGITLGG